ncbi:MAG: Rrf2 family transcriptional regulator [Coriobacteriales bacterium]|nr:Rrf2 family transcriptional regulator [Coriobacteriales bacterium]
MMRVSQRLDYALRALVLLAQQPDDVRVASGELADRLGLPRRFVEQQITELARAKVLTSTRGAAGGCALARPAEEITVRDIVVALEGDVLDVPRTTNSSAAEMWATAADRLAQFLSSTSLRDLAVRQKELDSEHAGLYDI